MMRYLELASALVAMTALAGCATFSTRLGGRSILGGYTLMDAPSSDVPVGAPWRQGYGPIGPGAAPGNLITRRSFNSLTLNRAARRGLEIRLAEYLGLEPSSQTRLSATVSEISIASVNDAAKLGLQPGAMYLSDAMKASKITIATSSDADVELVSSLEQRGLRVSAKGSADGQETLTVEGIDLFFAYRVIKLDNHERPGPPLGRVLKHPRAPGW